jgi:hypothetical protein
VVNAKIEDSPHEETNALLAQMVNTINDKKIRRINM